MNAWGIGVAAFLILAGYSVWKYRHPDEPFWTDEYQLSPDWGDLAPEQWYQPKPTCDDPCWPAETLLEIRALDETAEVDP